MEDASNFLMKMDPDIRRSMKARKALQNSIKCYQDLYKEKSKEDQ